MATLPKVSSEKPKGGARAAFTSSFKRTFLSSLGTKTRRSPSTTATKSDSQFIPQQSVENNKLIEKSIALTRDQNDLLKSILASLNNFQIPDISGDFNFPGIIRTPKIGRNKPKAAPKVEPKAPKVEPKAPEAAPKVEPKVPEAAPKVQSNAERIRETVAGFEEGSIGKSEARQILKQIAAESTETALTVGEGFGSRKVGTSVTTAAAEKVGGSSASRLSSAILGGPGAVAINVGLMTLDPTTTGTDFGTESSVEERDLRKDIEDHTKLYNDTVETLKAYSDILNDPNSLPAEIQTAKEQIIIIRKSFAPLVAERQAYNDMLNKRKDYLKYSLNITNEKIKEYIPDSLYFSVETPIVPVSTTSTRGAALNQTSTVNQAAQDSAKVDKPVVNLLRNQTVPSTVTQSSPTTEPEDDIPIGSLLRGLAVTGNRRFKDR